LAGLKDCACGAGGILSGLVSLETDFVIVKGVPDGGTDLGVEVEGIGVFAI
jgi:hypothetical protein